jgi:hypothetical protein
MTVPALDWQPDQSQKQKTPFICPQCHSTNTQSFEMAYMMSTQTQTTTGAAYTFGVGPTLAGARSSQQSALAERVQPPAVPERLQLQKWTWAFLFALFACYWLFDVSGLIVMFMTGSVLLYFIIRKDKADYERAG